jgi:hypothetical protein
LYIIPAQILSFGKVCRNRNIFSFRSPTEQFKLGESWNGTTTTPQGVGESLIPLFLFFCVEEKDKNSKFDKKGEFRKAQNFD